MNYQSLANVRKAARECDCGHLDCGIVFVCPGCRVEKFRVKFVKEADALELVCAGCGWRLHMLMGEPSERWRRVQAIFPKEARFANDGRLPVGGKGKVVSLFGGAQSEGDGPRPAGEAGGGPARSAGEGTALPVPSRGRPASRLKGVAKRRRAPRREA
jgi:hypothetical protein